MKHLMTFILVAVLTATNVYAQDTSAKQQAKEYIELGSKKIEIKEYDEAIKHLKKAAELDPTNGFAFMYLSHAYFSKGIFKMQVVDYKGAMIDFTYATQYREMDLLKDVRFLVPIEVYYNRGVCKNMLEQFGSAIPDFDKAIELRPNDKLAYFNRAVAKANVNDLTGACYDYTMAYKLGYSVSADIIRACNQ